MTFKFSESCVKQPLLEKGVDGKNDDDPTYEGVYNEVRTDEFTHPDNCVKGRIERLAAKETGIIEDIETAERNQDWEQQEQLCLECDLVRAELKAWREMEGWLESEHKRVKEEHWTEFAYGNYEENGHEIEGAKGQVVKELKQLLEGEEVMGHEAGEYGNPLGKGSSKTDVSPCELPEDGGRGMKTKIILDVIAPVIATFGVLAALLNNPHMPPIVWISGAGFIFYFWTAFIMFEGRREE